MTTVIVEPDESFESALKRFKKQCEKAGLLSEFKKRQHYEKPSVGSVSPINPGIWTVPPALPPRRCGNE